MRLRVAFFFLSPFVLLGGSALAATAGTKLKGQVAEAAAQDNAAGANALLQHLGQAFQMVQQHGKNPMALREWEEIVNDCQDAVAKMRSPEAHKYFVSVLSRVSQPTQAVLVRGLTKHPPEKEVIAPVVKLLDTTNSLDLQVASIELLGRYRAVEGVVSILKQLRPNNAVCLQVVACRALGSIPDKQAVAPLIKYLKDLKGGRMRFEANAALRALTGQNFNADAGTWDGWWQKNQADFKPVAEPQMVLNYELKVAEKEELTFYEIPLVENRIVFLFDLSGSMNLGGRPSRLDKTREQLKGLLNQLDETKALFNIITFDSNVKRWSRDQPLVPASAVNKKSACAFLDATKPAGTTSTIEAMEEALREIALLNGVEAIFLLTDGMPTPLMAHSNVRTLADVPKGVGDIRRRFCFINQTLKVRIHTIGVFTRVAGDPTEPAQDALKKFLRDVAADNDGVYKEVP